MKPVEKTVWFIESHYEEDINLDLLAEIAGVSRYTLSRAFMYGVGISLSRYLRHRRLTEAARSLVATQASILDLALAARYSSHEAFSRAFKDCFGTTPEQVRKLGHLNELNLLEAVRMSELKVVDISEPVISERGPLLLVGLSEQHSMSNNVGIPGQWQRFSRYMGQIAEQVNNSGYGVVMNSGDEDSFEYLCSTAVNRFADLPAELTRLKLEPQKYAIFSYPGHVSQIQKVCATIWGEWLPDSRYEAAAAPFIEHYPETFDGYTGQGGFEIWLPLSD